MWKNSLDSERKVSDFAHKKIKLFVNTVLYVSREMFSGKNVDPILAEYVGNVADKIQRDFQCCVPQTERR